MADPNVKNVSAAQVNKSLAANYSYIKKSSEKTINNSFGNLMQNSLNKMTDSSNKQNTSGKVTVRRSQVEYIVRGAKHTGDGKAVDESTMTGSLKALTGEVKAVVCAVLDMTDEELERYLAENGMCVMDLLLQNNLANFVADVAADGDSLKLITDSNLSETFSELGDELKKLVATAAQDMDISVEELNKYIQSTDFTDVSNAEPADEVVDIQSTDFTDVSNAESADEVVGTIDKTADTDELLSRRQNNPELENNGSAVEEPELGLEDKITVASSEDDASQSGTFQKSDESLSGQFLNTLIENVDNAVQAKEDFKGYSVNSENIVRQLVDAIKVNVNSSFSEMELQLQPENLGKLNLVIASRGGIITAQFMAENDVVKSAIENQIVMLKDNFEQQGLKVEAVEVMVQTHGFEMGKNLEGRGDNSQDDDDRHRTSRILTLEEINAINTRLKNDLETQVVNQSDSIGKIFEITSSLDSDEPESVFFHAAEVVSQLMDCRDVAIYNVSNRNYARLMSSTSESARRLGNSIAYTEYTQMVEAFKNRTVFVNRQLTENVPLMAAAILSNDEIQSIIMLWDISWDRLNLSFMNRFQVIGYLIQNAVLRANRYIDVLEHERYINGTKILEPAAFRTLLKAFLHAQQKGLTDCSLIQITPKAEGIAHASRALEKLFRNSDYLGSINDGFLYVLLANTSPKDAGYVTQRIAEAGYDYRLVTDIKD